MSESVLFVFAHQDDEVAVSPLVAREVRRGARVVCAFMTDGGKTTPPAVRDRESRAVLQELGVASGDIHFIGSASAIRDQALIEHLQRAYDALVDAVGAISFQRVVTLAWEGGHPDHDAAHLIAIAYAKQHHIARLEQFSLYHGRGVPGPFFRTLSPLTDRDVRVTRLGWAEGLRAAALWFRYPSQVGSWLVLFPETFREFAVMRQQRLQAVDVAAIERRPHEGRLLYERRYGLTHEDFRTRAQSFIDAMIRS